MKSSVAGKSTLKAEVTNISAQGIWLLAGRHEYFLSYDAFPEFKDARITDILNVEIEHEEYLFWPSLGIDLELESIKNPEKYPLRYK
ncbi:MAG: DUF2442 domain-containing protein [Chitinivibrionales bacterium]|nr:DUF2442 domain-containing protein [Chitinivibrionales bacterium]